MKDMTELKFTIPDAPAKEQIEMIKDLIRMMKAASKLTGKKVDLKPFKEQIKKLQGVEEQNL